MNLNMTNPLLPLNLLARASRPVESQRTGETRVRQRARRFRVSRREILLERTFPPNRRARTPSALALSPALCLALLGLWLAGRNAAAQSILTPRPEFSITPPAVLEYQTNSQMEVFAPPESVLHPNEPPLKLGPVGFRPHAFYRVFYATGLPASGTNHVTATVQEVSTGLLLDIGSHWRLDYTPTWRFYSNKQFRDTLDHNVRFVGGTTYQDWVFGLSQIYDASSEPLVETGTQTDQETFATALTASYQINSRMSVDAALNQTFISADQFQSSREWSTLDWLNWQFWPRLRAGLGLGFGYVDVETGSDMTYEQFQVRAEWRATDKLGFQVHGGGEVRQFLSGSADDLLNPIVAGVIQYQPFEQTRLSLTASRVVSASLLTTTAGQSQTTESTDVVGALHQRLLGKLFLELDGGWHTVTYVTASSGATSRDDDYWTFNARLGCTLLKRGTAAVFYHFSDVSSSLSGYSYSSSQVGFEAGYRF
jgi:hypothetical protein